MMGDAGHLPIVMPSPVPVVDSNPTAIKEVTQAAIFPVLFDVFYNTVIGRPDVKYIAECLLATCALTPERLERKKTEAVGWSMICLYSLKERFGSDVESWIKANFQRV